MDLRNLRILRTKKNISQIKLSTEIEISQELVSQYELGKSLPSIENLVKIADYFNCSTDYLLGLTNDFSKKSDLKKDDLEVTELIQNYSDLSLKNREKLKSYLNYLLKNENQKILATL